MKKRVDFYLTWTRLGLAAVGAVIAALAISFSGLVSIAASSGHFGPVGWFLHWTMQNVVARQSLGISVPEDIDLSDPSLVQRAAGHFATGCAPCHGAPGVPRTAVVQSMTPEPPPLEGQVGEWKDRELFWIVLHGIKYSGMPAWPSQKREDEVWAQVAFLRALPGMSRETYADLALGGGIGDNRVEAGGETTAALDGIVENALSDCARCHGRDGLGSGEGEAADAFPVIAGQPADYLYATLYAYSMDLRHSGFMEPAAGRYDAAVLRELANHYAEQPLPSQPGDPASEAEDPALLEAEAASDPSLASDSHEAPSTASEGAIPAQILPVLSRSTNRIEAFAAAGGAPADRRGLLALGRHIAEEGLPARKIPACESCHGEDREPKNVNVPYLGGQPEWYIDTHLHLFKEDKRGGTQWAHVMEPIATQMTDEQMKAVAAWYASQPLGR